MRPSAAPKLRSRDSRFEIRDTEQDLKIEDPGLKIGAGNLGIRIMPRATQVGDSVSWPSRVMKTRFRAVLVAAPLEPALSEAKRRHFEFNKMPG